MCPDVNIKFQKNQIFLGKYCTYLELTIFFFAVDHFQVKNYPFIYLLEPLGSDRNISIFAPKRQLSIQKKRTTRMTQQVTQSRSESNTLSELTLTDEENILKKYCMICEQKGVSW